MTAMKGGRTVPSNEGQGKDTSQQAPAPPAQSGPDGATAPGLATLLLCEPAVAIRLASGTLVDLTASQQAFLQLLGLAPPNERVPMSVLRLTSNQENGVQDATIRTTISEIRKKTDMADLISTGAGTAMLNRSVCCVDTDTLRSAIKSAVKNWEAYEATGEGNLDDIHSDLADLETREAKLSFKVPPHEGLERIIERIEREFGQGGGRFGYQLRTLEVAFGEWQALTFDFFFALSKARITSKREGRIKPAIQSLMTLVRGHYEDKDRVNEAWVFLILTLRQSHHDQTGYWMHLYREWCGDHEREADPRLDRVDEGIVKRPPREGSVTTADMVSLLKNTHALGMQAIPFEQVAMMMTPDYCIGLKPSRLWFLGALARKWVGTEESMDQLGKVLERLDSAVVGTDRAPVPVRFRIMNPKGPAYQKVWRNTVDFPNAGYVDRLLELERSHPCFKVRTYEGLPRFKLHIVRSPGRDLTSFSRYYSDRKSGEMLGLEERAGFVFDEFAEHPLSDLIYRYFLEIWHSGVPLLDAMKAPAAATEPRPPGEREYSGKFLVRVPPEAHRRLVAEAAEQGIELPLLARRRLLGE